MDFFNFADESCEDLVEEIIEDYNLLMNLKSIFKPHIDKRENLFLSMENELVMVKDSICKMSCKKIAVRKTLSKREKSHLFKETAGVMKKVADNFKNLSADFMVNKAE